MQVQAPERAVTDRQRVMAWSGDLALHPERYGVGGSLGHRQRQIDRGAAKRGIERPHRRVIGNLHRELPIGRPGYPIQERLRGIFRTKQAQVRYSLRVYAHAPVSARDVQACRATDDLRRQRRRAHVVGGERELAVELGKRRNVAGKLDAIVGKVVFADHLVAFRFSQGQLEPERHCSGAAGLGSIGKMVDPAGDRAFGNETQGIGGRARRLAVDAKYGVGEA